MKAVYGVITTVTMMAGPLGFMNDRGCGGNDCRRGMQAYLEDYGDGLRAVQQGTGRHSQTIDSATDADAIRMEEAAYRLTAKRWLGEMDRATDDMRGCSHSSGQATDPSRLRRATGAMRAAINAHAEAMEDVGYVTGMHRHEQVLQDEMGYLCDGAWAHHGAMCDDARRR